MLFLLPLLLIPSCTSLSCLPTCPTKDVLLSSCPSGEVVSGPCGCPECARAEREVCWGLWNIGGICAAGLICLDTTGKDIRWPESQIEGVCRPSCQEGSTLGWDYTGTKASTAEGRTCQAWDSSSPHGCGGEPCFPELKDNHCRNPDNETEGVWCYTSYSGKRWEYCNVPKCSEDPPCPQVLCCGSDGMTYPTPCAAPPGVTCVSNKECPPKACPHTDSEWTSWSTCSPPTACRSSRTRAIVAGCGKDCRKEKVMEERRCPSCCSLVSSPWSPWSPCPVACGGGVIRKTMVVVLEREGECFRQMIEQEDACNIKRCPAPGCPGFCVEIYQPVCGTNGQTYGNTCELQVASCQSSTSISAAYEGACVACPAERPEFGSSCDHPAGGQCTYGQECCCGECHPSLLMECGGAGGPSGSWVGRHSEACMLPTCPTTAPCPELCTADYTPVCGSDGQTYSNLCHLNIASCNSNTTITVAGQGECKPACGELACLDVWTPVCGSDGQTYSNTCYLSIASCNSNTTITVVSQGECKPGGF